MNVLVAMSGGVDSSVAAKLLTDAGCSCIGCTMKLYGNGELGLSNMHTCCSIDDTEDARNVAYQLKMRYYVFNFSDGFREKVMLPFADGYMHGLTPNPCIDCNRYMKFEKLFERARILGCDCIATGHYARIVRSGDRYVLKKALDETKDQSYVLYFMTQWQLAHTLFPLGDMRKSETRAMAASCGFVNALKPDSQDICFAPDGDYAAAIERCTGRSPEPGCFVDTGGNILGSHKGIIHYTVGQRRGLGIAAGKRKYVCRVCPEDNTVVLGDSCDLRGRDAEAGAVNWISGEAPDSAFRCKVRIRYRHQEQWAEVTPRDGGVHIRFDEPQRAITPGQAAVMYDGDTVLGGGVITAAE